MAKLLSVHMQPLHCQLPAVMATEAPRMVASQPHMSARRLGLMGQASQSESWALLLAAAFSLQKGPRKTEGGPQGEALVGLIA